MLHLAAAMGHLKMAHWLIGHGAEVDARTVQMSTPLMHASLSGKTEMVRLLIGHRADREARDSYGRTAIILVARDRGDADMARTLLDAGADINAADRWNDTALSLAAWRGFSDLVDLLLERGARIPSEPDQKQQGFVMAISKGLERLFDKLLPGAGPGRDGRTGRQPACTWPPTAAPNISWAGFLEQKLDRQPQGQQRLDTPAPRRRARLHAGRGAADRAWAPD